VAWCG